MPSPLDRLQRRAHGYGGTTVAVEDVRLLLQVVEAAQEHLRHTEVFCEDDELTCPSYKALRAALAPLLEDE